MVLPVNEIGTHAAAIGNHDLVKEGLSRISEKKEPRISTISVTFPGFFQMSHMQTGQLLQTRSLIISSNMKA